jgi:hypothetical protein
MFKPDDNRIIPIGLAKEIFLDQGIMLAWPSAGCDDRFGRPRSDVRDQNIRLLRLDLLSLTSKMRIIPAGCQPYG